MIASRFCSSAGRIEVPDGRPPRILELEITTGGGASVPDGGQRRTGRGSEGRCGSVSGGRACMLALALVIACGRSALSSDEPTGGAGSGGDGHDGGDAAVPTSTAGDAHDSGRPSPPGLEPDADASQGDAPRGPCNANNCSGGCCSGDTCIETPSPQACGSFGQPCVACPPGDICKGGCAGPVANCGPLNCPGCCLGPNTCSTGTFDVACGTGGQQCSRCVPNESTGRCIPNGDGGGGTCSTSAQGCDSVTCSNGCCSNGVCVDGESPDACGGAGAACKACASGEFCEGTVCRPGVPCGPQDCAGCCGGADGNTCLTGQDGNECGIGGIVCQNCAIFAQACVNGACVVPVACSPTTCPGCCYGDVCAVGDQAFLCGAGGAVCLNCQNSNSQCVNGACR